jgi:hypothetical protein
MAIIGRQWADELWRYPKPVHRRETQHAEEQHDLEAK